MADRDSGKRRRFFINFLGCEKRKLDTQRVYNYMKANGWRSTSKPEQADAVIFLTCAFCQKYEDWAVSKLEKIVSKKKPDAVLIIGGCLTEIHPERLNIFPNPILVETRNLDKFDEIIENNTVKMADIADPNTTIFDAENKTRDKTEKFNTEARDVYEDAKLGFKVRINWGCLGNCSYCVTKLATKKLKSKNEDIILKEIKKAVAQKQKSIFLTGGDAGAYGLDQNTNVVNLMELIFSVEGTFKISVQDFGIHWLIKYQDTLIPVFKKNKDRLASWCFPIQSGSNTILNRMRRPYKISDVLSVLKKLKSEVPELQIGTHFIIGFPGETKEDFNLTLEFFRNAPLDFLNVFRYTDHMRAESHSFPDKVSDSTILDRENRFEIEFYNKFPKDLEKKN